MNRILFIFLMMVGMETEAAQAVSHPTEAERKAQAKAALESAAAAWDAAKQRGAALQELNQLEFDMTAAHRRFLPFIVNLVPGHQNPPPSPALPSAPEGPSSGDLPKKQSTS